MLKKRMLFPPYLQRGSVGAAVDALHMILFMLGLGAGIVRDGDFGEMTESAVKKLQERLGLTGDDVDGKFGPGTRARLKEKLGIDVEAIPGSPKMYADDTNWVGPDTSEGEFEENWMPEYDV